MSGIFRRSVAGCARSPRRRGRIALATAAWAALSTPASALTVTNDVGGYIADYLVRYALIARSHEEVRIAGECHSACTLVLGIVPRERLCVTRAARFGFHRASRIDDRGNKRDSPEGTAELLALYPENVRAWLRHHGGLTRTMKFMSARASGLRPCK